MFKFKDNYKAAAAGLFTLGAVLAVVTFAFFATVGWLAAIAAVLMVAGCGVSLYSNVEFEKDTTLRHAPQPAKEPAANVAAGTAVNRATAAPAHQPAPEAAVTAAAA